MLNIYHLHIIILGWMFLWLRTASILFLIIIRLLQQYKWIQWNDDKCPGVRRTETGLLWLKSPEKWIQDRMSEASALSQIWEQRVSFFLQFVDDASSVCQFPSSTWQWTVSIHKLDFVFLKHTAYFPQRKMTH